MRVKKFLAVPSVVLGLSLPGLIDCSAANKLEEAAAGCDEFKGGADSVGKLEIDAKVKAFVAASADLQAVAVQAKADVKAACADLATQLGGTDTWTAMGDDDKALTNSDKTGACDVAAAKIDAILKANATANATLTITGSQCTVDADVQAQCEGSCKADVMCTEPELTARCDPGQLTGQCSGTCNAMAVCEGTADVQADCQGSCEAQCTGTCSGACTGTVTGGCMGTCEGKCDGVATPAGGMGMCMGTCEGKCSAPAATATCTGKCEASCKGKCSGSCKLDATAMVNCGASVNCKGGCSVAYTAPKCEGELKPPMCTGDANCQASCSGRAELKAQCTPPQVNFTFTGDSMDLLKLQAALKADLPKLWVIGKTEADLLRKAAGKVFATGQVAVSAYASFSGKAIACATVAAEATVKASASVSVSVQASASVSSSASGGT